MYDRQQLIDLVRQLGLKPGDFTLASGKKSSYYLDCRKVTLDSQGANLIAHGMLELLGGELPDAVGGMAIGADPITAAIIPRLYSPHAAHHSRFRHCDVVSDLKKGCFMIDVADVVALHRDMVVRWHSQEVDNPYDGFLGLVCRQCSFNYLLWHEEDIARSPDVSDAEIARVKRSIDRYNQQRNDAIEQLDDWITAKLAELQIDPQSGARQASETPGSVIDRLSILALRIYHLQEQVERADASPQHIESVQRKLAVALAQHDDLSQSLSELIDDICSGRKRHKTYRQMKMYNDASLNPYLYRAKNLVASELRQSA
jgi:hypothetical protein